MRRLPRDCVLVGCRVLARGSAVPLAHGPFFCSSLLTATAKSGTVGVTASSLATLPFTATQLSWPTLARRQPVRACSLELAGWHAALHEVCASQSVDVGEVCPAAPVAGLADSCPLVRLCALLSFVHARGLPRACRRPGVGG